jgi:hypothetical protein
MVMASDALLVIGVLCFARGCELQMPGMGWIVIACAAAWVAFQLALDRAPHDSSSPPMRDGWSGIVGK